MGKTMVSCRFSLKPIQWIKYQKYPEHIGHCETNIWPMVHVHTMDSRGAREPKSLGRTTQAGADPCGVIKRGWKLPVFLEVFWMGHKKLSMAHQWRIFQCQLWEHRKVSNIGRKFTCKKGWLHQQTFIRIKHRQNSANVTGQSECITIHHQPDGEWIDPKSNVQ